MQRADPSAPSIAPRSFGFLLHFVVIGALLPQALAWDGLGFLLAARPPLTWEPAHPGYVFLLRVVTELGAPLGLGPEGAARMLSALGAAGVFTLLWARGERHGLGSGPALLTGLVCSCSLVLWHLAGAIEPTTLVLCGLLSSRALAERLGRSENASHGALLAASVLVTLSLHVVSILALPWILFGLGRRPARLELVLATVLFGLPALAALGFGQPAELLRYARGFTPEIGLGTFFAHVRHAWSFLLEGAPLLFAAGTLSIGCAWKRIRPQGVTALVLPHLAAYLLFGKPVVALLLPVCLGLALALQAGMQALEASRLRSAWLLVFSLGLGLQTAYGTRVAFHQASATDPLLARALHWHARLPADAHLVAGPLAQHLRWTGDAPLTALPEALHAGRVRGLEPFDAVRFALEEARARTPGLAIYFTPESLEYLRAEAHIDPRRLVAPQERDASGPDELLPFEPGP